MFMNKDIGKVWHPYKIDSYSDKKKKKQNQSFINNDRCLIFFSVLEIYLTWWVLLKYLIPTQIFYSAFDHLVPG